MTEPKSCKLCGMPFTSNGISDKCTQCTKRDEDDFKKVREYLYLHPGAKIFDVSKELDMSISKIKRYLREGRIEIVEKNNRFLKCEVCGKSLCSGLYCDVCYKAVANGKVVPGTSSKENTNENSQKLEYRSKVNFKSSSK